MSNKRFALLGVCAVISAFIGAMIIGMATAKADISPRLGTIVCGAFDRHGVSVASVTAIGWYLIGNEGYTGKQSARILIDSVLEWCPEYGTALLQVAQQAAPSSNFAT